MEYSTMKPSDTQEMDCRPLTEAEKSVRSVVVSTLAVVEADITFNTSLFRYGLNSLSAISSAIKMQRLGYDWTVPSVLTNPTIWQLALLSPQNQTSTASAARSEPIRSRLLALESRSSFNLTSRGQWSGMKL